MANLEFTEYVAAKAIYGGQTGLTRGQANATQQIAIGATSAVSAAFAASTNLIEVSAVGADCRIEIGASTVAATNAVTFSRRLRAGRIYRFAVDGGQFLAVIAIEGGADTAAPVAAVTSDASQYTEDAAAAADPIGPMLMAVRRDTPSAAEVSADGDNVAAKANSRGMIYVDVTFGIADGGTDAGGSAKVGGVYSATKPTLTDGKRGALQLGTRGAAAIQWMLPDSASAVTSAAAGADAVSNTFNGYFQVGFNVNYNGTTWDRARGDTNGTVVQLGLSSTFWNYAAATGGIANTTTAVTVKAAAGASVRNYVTGLQIDFDSLGAATEVAIRDGAAGTVLWRGKIPAGAAGMREVPFPVPLKGTANTLLEVVTLTASVTGGVFFNLQGYTGA